jgi:hypothetical protein
MYGELGQMFPIATNASGGDGWFPSGRAESPFQAAIERGSAADDASSSSSGTAAKR